MKQEANYANLRCPWGQTRDQVIQNFHDHEWGKLDLNDRHLFEMLVLQLFQSGLSWRVILHKRENFRKAFKNFSPAQVAQISKEEVEELMQDASIIRNRIKIEGAIKNARAVVNIQAKEGSFAKYLQKMVPEQIVHRPEIFEDVPTSSELSKTIAKQMRQDGFYFVGPTITYSYLQSIGLINDHINCCPFKYEG